MHRLSSLILLTLLAPAPALADIDTSRLRATTSPAQGQGRAGMGDSQAQFALAMRWYREAAEAGYAPAMNNLGIMYGLGEGIARDDAQAYAWFITSASRGDTNAQKNRDLTRAELDAPTRSRGESIAKSLQARLP